MVRLCVCLMPRLSTPRVKSGRWRGRTSGQGIPKKPLHLGCWIWPMPLLLFPKLPGGLTLDQPFFTGTLLSVLTEEQFLLGDSLSSCRLHFFFGSAAFREWCCDTACRQNQRLHLICNAVKGLSNTCSCVHVQAEGVQGKPATSRMSDAVKPQATHALLYTSKLKDHRGNQQQVACLMLSNHKQLMLFSIHPGSRTKS